MRRVRNMNRIRLKIYECILKYMKWNWVFMAWLLTKHTLLTWIHFGTDTLVTPALTFEYMQIVNAMVDTVVTVKDFISMTVTMMAADGQVR